jgi:alpha-tubulin suppressor-like RCC1 family protein
MDIAIPKLNPKPLTLNPKLGIMDITIPTPLLERHNIPPNVKAICCGYTFSLALTTNGEVFSWGQGESGELGHAAKVLAYAPTQINDFQRIESLAAGHRHAAAVQFTPRTIYLEEAKGMENEEGGGGLDNTMHSRSTSHAGSGMSTPSRSEKSSKFSKGIHLGGLQAHMKKHGYGYVWGEDTCGQLGMRGLQGARSPTMLQNMSALSLKDCSASQVFRV